MKVRAASSFADEIGFELTFNSKERWFIVFTWFDPSVACNVFPTGISDCLNLLNERERGGERERERERERTH